MDGRNLSAAIWALYLEEAQTAGQISLGWVRLPPLHKKSTSALPSVGFNEMRKGAWSLLAMGFFGSTTKATVNVYGSVVQEYALS